MAIRRGSRLDNTMVAVVVTSLIALVQHDMKKLIAYSSVAHMAIAESPRHCAVS